MTVGGGIGEGGRIVRRFSVGVDAGGAHLEVIDDGSGEPVLFIQTALLAEELRPLCDQPPLAGFRRVRPHRRGYAGSSPATTIRPIVAEAADCLALMDRLGIERAHVVGLSFSAVVAMQLAADVPERVHTLCLIEAPPVHTPGAARFRAANEELAAHRAAHGARAALDRFLSRLLGPGWRTDVERLLPGAVAQMTRDAATFFDSDAPALLAWSFGPPDAARFGGPVLYLTGDATDEGFTEVADVVVDWYPRAEARTIAGADHNLALTHAPAIAPVLAGFLGRHPIGEW